MKSNLNNSVNNLVYSHRLGKNKQWAKVKILFTFSVQIAVEKIKKNNLNPEIQAKSMKIQFLESTIGR